MSDELRQLKHDSFFDRAELIHVTEERDKAQAQLKAARDQIERFRNALIVIADPEIFDADFRAMRVTARNALDVETYTGHLWEA